MPDPTAGASGREIASLIDHTLLRPDATEREIIQLCLEARRYGFAAACLAPIWVPVAARQLDGAGSRVCTVVGFPHGSNPAEAKACETALAVDQGAREIDMVIPVGAMKSGEVAVVADHIRAVVRAAGSGAIVKVILECCYLADAEKIAVCRIARDEGAAFVKTSTGFGSSGATVEDVHLMRAAAGAGMGVKAAGGIRDRQTALSMIEAGATRLGTSASVRIVESAM